MPCEDRDVIIVGSGISALMLADKITAFKNVVILTKSKNDKSNSMLSQGGIAVSISSSDHWYNHFKDTLNAGCNHNDPTATKVLVENGPPSIKKLIDGGMQFDRIIPITYVNSTAAIKAFVGENGGATVTSSNAKKMLKWAFTQKERILFLPDQHLGRNTAFEIGVPLEKMAVWNPTSDQIEYVGNLQDVKVILWKGHCSVHENFTVENVNEIKKNKPSMNIIVHPECSREVVALADYVGSTKYIIETIENAPNGSKWAIGTEMNLVNRLIENHSDKEIVSLNPHMCPCLTMNRIDLPHLLWVLESLKRGEIINQISVNETIAKGAVLALKRMLTRA
ncbi:quinolinate synthase NadA [Cytobacillus sp. S13-E01]|nr:quinolinate synthase NadA [Cytobacillus sp. S13-E01]MDF0726784.1 quinolinate synthase NadA [Cytobacillus sp. S13-E01]